MAHPAAISQPPAAAAIEQALALHQAGRFNEAERIYSAILAAAPGRLDALHLLGLLRHQQGQNVEALRLIGAVLKAVPQSAEVLNNHGIVLNALGRHQEALARFDEAMAIRPGYLDALVNRVWTLARMKRHEEALAGNSMNIAGSGKSLPPRVRTFLSRCGAARRIWPAKPFCSPPSKAWVMPSSSCATLRSSPRLAPKCCSRSIVR
jgi:Tfp pilus assembly protein PilF